MNGFQIFLLVGLTVLLALFLLFIVSNNTTSRNQGFPLFVMLLTSILFCVLLVPVQKNQKGVQSAQQSLQNIEFFCKDQDSQTVKQLVSKEFSAIQRNKQVVEVAKQRCKNGL